WLMMSLWDALRMNMMISYQELVRTFLKTTRSYGEVFQIKDGSNKPNSNLLRPLGSFYRACSVNRAFVRGDKTYPR
ncbi:hypothetical protein VC840_08550, partial [Citrobacter portucalensis]